MSNNREYETENIEGTSTIVSSLLHLGKEIRVDEKCNETTDTSFNKANFSSDILNMQKDQNPASLPLFEKPCLTVETARFNTCSNTTVDLMRCRNTKTLPEILMHLLMDERFSDIISFVPTSDGVIRILDPQEFTWQVIPFYFGFKNLGSFVKKLERFGFQVLPEDSSSSSCIHICRDSPSRITTHCKTAKKPMSLYHPNFKQGDWEALKTITYSRHKRKIVSFCTSQPSHSPKQNMTMGQNMSSKSKRLEGASEKSEGSSLKTNITRAKEPLKNEDTATMVQDEPVHRFNLVSPSSFHSVDSRSIRSIESPSYYNTEDNFTTMSSARTLRDMDMETKFLPRPNFGTTNKNQSLQPLLHYPSILSQDLGLLSCYPSLSHITNQSNNCFSDFNAYKFTSNQTNSGFFPNINMEDAKNDIIKSAIQQLVRNEKKEIQESLDNSTMLFLLQNLNSSISPNDR